MGILEHNEHEDQVERIEDDWDEQLHPLNIDTHIEGWVYQIDGSHYECYSAQVLSGECAPRYGPSLTQKQQDGDEYCLINELCKME